ncbi:MAG: hypothetical protein AVDCRST_MAG12-205, partial [uncultured Rubrobacteraceae bacterium]
WTARSRALGISTTSAGQASPADGPEANIQTKLGPRSH